MNRCQTCGKRFYNPYQVNGTFCCIQCEQNYNRNYNTNYKETNSHLNNLMKIFGIDK